MEEERIDSPEAEEIQSEEVYTPRPRYQVWAARIGLVIVILGVLLYYWHIASGGRI